MKNPIILLFFILLIMAGPITKCLADNYKVTVNSKEYKVFRYIESKVKTENDLFKTLVISFPTALGQNMFFTWKIENRVIYIPMQSINYIEIEKIK